MGRMPEVGNHQYVLDFSTPHFPFFHPIQVGSNEKFESLMKSSRVVSFVSFSSAVPFETIGYIFLRLTTVFVLFDCHSIF